MSKINCNSRWLVGATLLFPVAATIATAGHETSGVKSYTGCLTDGTIIKIKEGEAPSYPCTGMQTRVHFSGGDITAIAAGAGLTGGGVNGLVTLSIDPKYTLPQGCASGQVAKWNGGGWTCAEDNDTQYAAGTGLDLVGTTFSVEPDAFAKTGQSCGAGKYATGVDASGNLNCASLPASNGVAVWKKSAADKVFLPDGEGVDVIQMPLPAGTYLVTAVGAVRDADNSPGDEVVRVACQLRDAANVIISGSGAQLVDIADAVDEDKGPAGAIVLHGVITFAAADTLKFQCWADDELDEILNPVVTAIKVGSLTTP